MIPSRFEDIAAIHAARTPDELWRYLVSTVHLRALRNTFDAMAAFHSLHEEGSDGALRTAQLLCTDLRWRNVTAPLIVDIEQTGFLDEQELDELADGFLWEDVLGWPVPDRWLRDGFVRVTGKGRRPDGHLDVVVERRVPPPLRRWAAARVVARHPDRIADILDRVPELDAGAGDAVMSGILDRSRGLPAEAHAELVELGSSWPSGAVRLVALKLLAETDPSAAADRGLRDASEKVRSWAAKLGAPSPPATLFD